MAVTRRDMVRTMVVAAGAGLWPARAMGQGNKGGGGTADPIPMHPDLSMTREAFSSQLGQYFTAHHSAGQSRLKLDKVTDCAAAVAAGAVGSDTCFTAWFQGARGEMMQDGIYPVDTPQYGRMELFLKLSQMTSKGARYEVAINRFAAFENGGH
jgi:hypothetical protein